MAELDGTNLIGWSYEEAYRWVLARDPHLVEEDGGLTSRTLGIALYADGANKDRNTPVESVLAFRPGYYDKD